MADTTYFNCPTCKYGVPFEDLNDDMEHVACGTKVVSDNPAWDDAVAADHKLHAAAAPLIIALLIGGLALLRGCV